MSLLRLSLAGSAGVLGLLLLLFGACRTDGPDTTTAGAADEDTAVAEASPSDTSTAMPDSADRPGPPPPAPAPGTARLRAEIIECDASAEPVRCQVRVITVLAYGSSTPPISSGEHAVRLASSLLDERGVSALEASGPRTVVARHAGDQPDLGQQSGNERPEWTIQSIRP
ncbi:MAG: hypothetical protein BRD32_02120 [Bacteroidetes bacterium QH_2_64_74]|nr:MAG: hypothetical protein BRD32_02120 [Bacteroidetes bacterium QH_2_64_74]